MTRRHYQLIAYAIRTLPLPDDVRRMVAEHFAACLVGTNPHYDPQRFMRACMGG